MPDNNPTMKYKDKIDDILDDFGHSVINHPEKTRIELNRVARKKLSALLEQVRVEEEDE